MLRPKDQYHWLKPRPCQSNRERMSISDLYYPQSLEVQRARKVGRSGSTGTSQRYVISKGQMLNPADEAKSVYYDKGQYGIHLARIPSNSDQRPLARLLMIWVAVEFANTTRSPLPIIAVDLPVSLLGGLALDHAWLTEDDAWRAVLVGVPNEDRRYAEVVRDAIRTRGTGSGSGGVRNNGWVWLFSVRESRVSQFFFPFSNPE